ncbi:MAG: hypothetical protein FJX25_13595 [Alphaproteobacteria bacterium]|nr:hypothetical protein [Alphaproteobacteria bacterium]
MPNSGPLRVLVVEDDYFLAANLSHEIRSCGDEVIGPFSNVQEALCHVPQSHAAILDVKLWDDTSFAVADMLLDQTIPFLFLTGYDRPAIPRRFGDRPVYTKPERAPRLLSDLRQQRDEAAVQPVQSLEAVVREMMEVSRGLMPDAASADRLIEATLVRAIEEVGEGRLEGDIRNRLFGMLRDEHRLHGRLYMH